MRISTRCSLTLHTLLLVAEFGHRGKLTSERIAMSTGCNPVMVRGIVSSLKQAGYLDVPRGSGGATLAIEPAQLSLWMVYSAVDQRSLDQLVGVHPNPSQQCPVGRSIDALLEKPYRHIGDSVRQAMEHYTLADLIADYRALAPKEQRVQ